MSLKNEAEFEISTLRYFKRVENGLKKKRPYRVEHGKNAKGLPKRRGLQSPVCGALDPGTKLLHKNQQIRSA